MTAMRPPELRPMHVTAAQQIARSDAVRGVSSGSSRLGGNREGKAGVNVGGMCLDIDRVGVVRRVVATFELLGAGAVRDRDRAPDVMEFTVIPGGSGVNLDDARQDRDAFDVAAGLIEGAEEALAGLAGAIGDANQGTVAVGRGIEKRIEHWTIQLS